MKKISLIIFFISIINLAQTESVEKVLNEDGTIKTGENGSYNIDGYFLQYGENNEPKLLKNSESITNVVWDGIGEGRNGFNSSVTAIFVNGEDVYFGGNFTIAGDIVANHIVKWTPNTDGGGIWTALGDGISGYVYALTVIGTDLYAGGNFTTAGGITANYIAKWDGSSWTALGAGTNGLNGTVYALAVNGTDLYVGGSFTTAGGSTANYVAKWDGSSWTALGTGTNGVNGTVNALAVSGTDLYVGGYFTTAGGSSANSVAKWNGTSWLPLGDGLSGIVKSLAVIGTDLYTAGEFTTAGGSTANRVAKWNGSSWAALGTGTNGVNGTVNALAVIGTDLYTAGEFTTAGGSTANRVAKWNGSSWTALGTGTDGVNNLVYALAVNGLDLYVGGGFTYLGDNSTIANRIVKWSNNSWLPFNAYGTLGANNYIKAIAVMGQDIYIGGSFTKVGDLVTANYIAKWNITNKTWSELGVGLNNAVNALAVIGTDLFVGGLFTTAGGSSANYIAKWDGTGWSVLEGTGTNGTNNIVNALAVIGTDLYVGGGFTAAGGSSAYRVAKWNGASWSALGSETIGLNNSVYALAISGTDLYIGGSFTDIYGASAYTYNRIVKWTPADGGSWLPLGVGLNNSVSAIVVSGTDLYVGGSFTDIYGASAYTYNRIVKWTPADGGSWLPLGVGLNNSVNAIAVSGTDLYVGGFFTSTYSGSANSLNYLAKWDGTEWSALVDGEKNGVSGLVYKLCIDSERNRMLVGGSFLSGGTKLLYYIGAFADEDNAFPVELSKFTVSTTEKGVILNWITTTEINNYGYEIERKTKNKWEKIGFVEGGGNSNSTKSYSFNDFNPEDGIISYRLKQIDINGDYKYSEVIAIYINLNNILPNDYSIEQNYPNPFNPSTTINFSLPKTGKVVLEIYNVLGEKVTTLINNDLTAGYHSVNFNGSSLASGVYIYRLQSGNYTQAKKMTLEK